MHGCGFGEWFVREKKKEVFEHEYLKILKRSFGI